MRHSITPSFTNNWYHSYLLKGSVRSKWEENRVFQLLHYQFSMETIIKCGQFVWRLIGGFGSLGSNRRELRGPSISRKSYYSTNQSTEGKEDKKIKGKSLPICSCISNDLHANNVPQNSKRNMGLPQV